jgi:recombination associated protein RdgC
MEGQSQDDGGFDADVAIATGELSRLIPDLIEALGGEGRTGLGQDLPASLQTPAAQAPATAPRAAESGRGALTGPATAPVDTAPEEAPF